jgi:oxygen-independent coproporphyrinogen-3 oxidase
MIPNDFLIQKYNTAIPRYTSYPPANYFVPKQLNEYTEALQRSNAVENNSISIYIHIPFCKQLCWYCGCNTIICNTQSTIDAYIETVCAEMNYVFSLLDKSRVVTQIHFGGGSPNSLSVEQLATCIHLISQTFTISANAEIAIECNPADIDLAYISAITALGFNRISLGIQDFDAAVLHAVHRNVPTIPIEAFVETIKTANAHVNFDFIYGLPLQTPQQFKRTIEQAIALQPDRLVTFSYAHVPSVKPHQKHLEQLAMPTAHNKLEMLTNTLQCMQQAGYTSIGFDHFAKPTDSLSVAKKNRTLHRNFQGYCTRETTGQVFAFGASGITQLADSYFQNVKDIQTYTKNVASQFVAPYVGYCLSHDEIITAAVIEYILCNESLNWQAIAVNIGEAEHAVRALFPNYMKLCQEFQRDGLLEFTQYGFDVTLLGKFFLRNIVAAFDSQFVNGSKIFSKTI